jgi:hypothetical protein
LHHLFFLYLIKKKTMSTPLRTPTVAEIVVTQRGPTAIRNASDDIELKIACGVQKQHQDIKVEETKVEETCPDGSVDIRGLDKFRLLEAMCANRRWPPNFLQQVKINRLDYLDRDYVHKLVHAAGGRWSFDYLRGHCIKSNLTGPWMAVWGYDRDVVGLQLKMQDLVQLLRDNPASSASTSSSFVPSSPPSTI